MQSLFEGSMYTFVFLWTPALSPKGERLPHGMIFACFMVASMAGAPSCLSACGCSCTHCRNCILVLRWAAHVAPGRTIRSMLSGSACSRLCPWRLFASSYMVIKP